MAELMEYLKWAKEEGASDLFVVPGSPVSIKKGDRLIRFDEGKRSPLDTEQLVKEIYAKADRTGGSEYERFAREGDDDFAFGAPELRARFRVNVYLQRGSMAAVIRLVDRIKDWHELGIPREVMKLAERKDGMVLVTGKAGSGKSTTQACIINAINSNPNLNYHIVTLEDPIEYTHRNQHSIISQREIGIDSKDYPSALRACLRQAPNVILLGEMRDQETIQTAMTAAETGHLVIATLHTGGAKDSIDRIVDAFPASQQSQVRVQLSMALRTVVSQQLVPDETGTGLVPAFEIMHVNAAIRNLIRSGETPEINKKIAECGGEGMISMDQYLLKLWEEGYRADYVDESGEKVHIGPVKIAKETAKGYAMDRRKMCRLMGEDTDEE